MYLQYTVCVHFELLYRTTVTEPDDWIFGHELSFPSNQLSESF